MKKTYILLLSFALLFSCKNPETTNNSSKITSKTIETAIYKISAFNKVTNTSIVNIEITDEVPTDEIHFISSKENLEFVKHEVVNNELIFSHTTKNLEIKDVKIIAKINSANINSFKIEGAGYIKSNIIQKAQNIKTEIEGAGSLELKINNNSIENKIEGLGNITLSGRTDNAKTEIEGAGNLNAFELETNNTYVSIEGLGNANVNASEKLEANISGIGNLTYKGNPKEIFKNKDGLGSIKAY